MKNIKILSNGFISGYTYCFIAISLQAALTDSGYTISLLSSLALIILPYSFKFLWSGFSDQIERTSIEELISLFIIIISFNFIILFLFDNFYSPLFYITLLNLAFLGSCFDILTDAYLIRNSSDEQRPKLLTYYIFGWRLAFIFAGGVILYFFENLLQSNIRQLFLLSGIVFSIFFLGYTKPKKFISLSIFKKYYQYILMLFPPISLYFILKMILNDFKGSFSVVTEIKELLTFSIFYKLFDITFTSLITIFILQQFNIRLDAFGILNSIASLISIFTCGYLWSKLSEIFSEITTLVLSSLFKTLTLVICIYSYYFDTYNIYLLFLLFTFNLFSTTLITYSFSNFLMSAVKGSRSSSKYSILTSLPMIFLLFTVPISSFLVNHYSWMYFFIFIIFLQVLSFLSLLSIKSEKKLVV